jgi:urea transport system permease protein
MRILLSSLFIWLTIAASNVLALDTDAVRKLATGDSDERTTAIAALLAEGDARARDVMQALTNSELFVAGERILIVRGEQATDALTGETVTPVPEPREEVGINNRLRRELGGAIAALDLVSPDTKRRRAAVDALGDNADPSVLPLVKKAMQIESDPKLKSALGLVQAKLEIKSPDRNTRLAAIKLLGASDAAATKTLLLAVLEKNSDGSYVETDSDLRNAAQQSLHDVEYRLAWAARISLAFSGLSLGSILLLAALGLAITYGLMGVINMAHGELIMIGAYATWLVQGLFKTWLPGGFDYYLIAAVPVAFTAAALVGMLMERTVIRFLYGRPLETLLATWGISLVLMQTARTLFGAQNVSVENPAWMSGGIALASNVVLPWNRIIIIAFALAVLVAVALLLTRTRLGLFVRATTQNRAMARCLGVPARRVDTLAFGLGAGLAGLGGCALSQIGNVGPDLGQAYIIDAFMVVVLGGVGQLAGAVSAAIGLGVVNKLIEGVSGPVIAKIAVLLFIVAFIQKRPQGLFALRGRSADA